MRQWRGPLDQADASRMEGPFPGEKACFPRRRREYPTPARQLVAGSLGPTRQAMMPVSRGLPPTPASGVPAPTTPDRLLLELGARRMGVKLTPSMDPRSEGIPLAAT